MDVFPLPFGDTDVVGLDYDATDAFARRVGWLDDEGVITPGQTRVQRRALSWWPNHDLILARDPAWEGVMGAWVHQRDGGLTRLDGTSPPIHQINGSTRPNLTDKTALAYLGFFCAFVHGTVEGTRHPFATIADGHDAFLPTDLSDEARTTIDGFARPPQILDKKASSKIDGAFDYHIESLVYYSDALFVSNFVVEPDGMIQMIQDEPLASEFGATINMRLTFERKSPDATNRIA